MVQCMVTHLNKLLKLHQKASKNVPWLKYDIEFRIKMTDKEDQVWRKGRPYPHPLISELSMVRAL